MNMSTENDEPKICCPALCDPRRSFHRFIALVFMCFLGFGSYFCYDNPGALQSRIKNDMNINTAQFASLYAWYSWPNVFLCFVGGFLLDTVFGIRLGTVLFAFFVFFGQLIFAAGGLLNAFWLMEAGRFVFGIGGESLQVAQNTYAVSWFKGKELNMVFGLQMSFARVGSTVNFNVMGPLYTYIHGFYHGYTCTGVVLMLASATCILSLLCAVVLAWLDRRADKFLKKSETQIGEVIRLSDVKDFPSTFWLLTLIGVTYYVAIYPFISLGQVFFKRKFDLSPGGANAVNSLLYTISAVVSPFQGFLVDKTGRNISWVLFSIVGTIVAHIMLTFTFWNPYIGVAFLGFFYSMLASALWPMAALMVPEHQLGTAYGIMQAFQNLGLALMTMLAGYIVDSNGYLYLEIFFLACLFISLIAGLLLWILDVKEAGNLNMSISERDESDASKLRSEDTQNLLESTTEINPSDLLRPRSDFLLRNRFLSKLGAELPSHLDYRVFEISHRKSLR